MALRRRPIDGYAFVIFVVGYIATGIGLYVNGLQWESRERVVWLEAFCGRWFWPGAFLSAGFGLSWILRRCRSVRALVITFVLPGVFGGVAGFLYGVLDSGYNEMIFYTHWYSMFLLPAEFGDRITNIVFHDGWDWQGGEIQYYTIEISFFSSLVWLVASAVISLPTYFLSHRQSGPASLPPNSANATATS